VSLTRDGQFQYLVGKIDLQRSLNQYLQVLLKHRTEYTILLYTIIRSGESTGRSQNISLIVPLFTFAGHYRGIHML
jgi:hypothetical protein